MRLIDADALDDVVMRINAEENRGITRSEYKLIDSVLFEFPTIEPERTGKWINLDATEAWYYMCSECHHRTDDKWNFCPNCGCRMTEDTP